MLLYQPNERELEQAKELIHSGFMEDLPAPTHEDITSKLLFDNDIVAKVAITPRKAGILAGTWLIPLIADHCKIKMDVDIFIADGSVLNPNTVIAQWQGKLVDLLKIERVTLNFLQHLSGIATATARFVEATKGNRATILDTRKTTPGYRYLEKYAARMGGATNHRFSLCDGILIKDNHLAGLEKSFNNQEQLWHFVQERIKKARQEYVGIPIEIEVDTLEQFTLALKISPDIILLDNMPPALIAQIVELRNQSGLAVLLEASGGITLENVKKIAETGVDRISIGSITHSAPALDIGLDYEW